MKILNKSLFVIIVLSTIWCNGATFGNKQGVLFMEHWLNINLENIEEEINGIIYTEEWRDVEGYEELYKVSSFGRVLALHKVRFILHKTTIEERNFYTKILKQSLRNNYPFVVLYNVNGKRLQISTHRVVAKTFTDNIYNKPCVNHINGVKTYNFYLNLEWCTYKENTAHSLRTGLNDVSKRIYPKGGDCKHSKAVYMLGADNKEIKRFECITDAAKYINGLHGGISSVLRQRKKTYFGFKWRYA